MDFKIGAVILAAGGSSRFGAPKQLLQLNGKSVLQHVIDLAEAGGFAHIALVLGANQEEIESQIHWGEKVEVVHNPDWEQGQSSSVRRGVQALESRCDALLFLLADQPLVSVALIHQEIEIFEKEHSEIIAPIYGGVKGNPVLFSRSCFFDLQAIRGDQGGRAIFAKHHLRELVWAAEDENLDIDTPDDYTDLVSRQNNAHSQLSTIILAAGTSSRMKKPKLVLPWGGKTVLGAVISAYQEAGVGEIVVVSGGYREVVEQEAAKYGVNTVFNPDYENGEMADSLKVGLSVMLNPATQAVFVALADQPGTSSHDISKMADLYRSEHPKLLIPSYEMRRGHPWLIDRTLWEMIAELHPPQTMRDFIEANKERVVYYPVENSRILDDLDTPEDYERLRPG